MSMGKKDVHSTYKRLFLLINLLVEYTDEKHPTDTREIMKYYAANNVTSDRKTLDKDIVLIKELGYDIVKTKSSPNKYYIASRTIDTDDLKMVIKAVQAYNRISPEERIVLSDKLMSLCTARHEEEVRAAMEKGKARLERRIEKQKETEAEREDDI